MQKTDIYDSLDIETVAVGATYKVSYVDNDGKKQRTVRVELSDDAAASWNVFVDSTNEQCGKAYSLVAAFEIAVEGISDEENWVGVK